MTNQQEADLLVACTDLASDPRVCAYIQVGSDDDLLHSNFIVKCLRNGDTVAQIIESFRISAAPAPPLLPTACIDETPMEP